MKFRDEQILYACIVETVFEQLAEMIVERIGLSPGNEFCELSERIVKATGLPKQMVVAALNRLSGFDPEWGYFDYLEASGAALSQQAQCPKC